jgi:GTP-binding protein EngB required for normal cell division
MPRGIGDFFRSLLRGSETPQPSALPVAIDFSTGSGTATIYARKATAAILGSVLKEAETGGNGVKSSAISAPAPQPTSAKIRVGEELKATKEKLAALGAELRELGDTATAEYVSRILALLEAQLCRIAVLGQMNSGKSTLVNAFIETPDFLPAEITPWTTVVTNLYFGVPGMPTSGAVFDFFDADEWQRLAEGSARVRELTEKLIPDFDWPAFYRQVGDMREKARTKMGPQFEKLLGGQHSFPEVTSGLLQKYVCAEPSFEEPEGTCTGEFSLITKAANLYFDLGGFFYPTLLIDTPGINDPFLVRDEITRQNLERANIFIIVVTARQPLSNADVDLLRILRGLDKGRIIVFVNKIDEVEDFPDFESAIEQRVRGVLEKEFPGVDIPVIMGSARWAGSVLSGDEQRELPKLPPQARQGAREAAAHHEDGGNFWMPDETVREAMAAEEVLMRSGVPALALAVSEMMAKGPVADCLDFSTAALAAVAINAAAVAEARARLVERCVETVREGRRFGDAEVTWVRGELEAAGDVAAQIEGTIAGAAAGFEEHIAERLTAMRQRLLATLQEQAAQLSIPGGESPRGASQAGGASVNVMPLRTALEQVFISSFRQMNAGLADLAAGSETRLHELVRLARETAGVALAYSPLPMLRIAPPIAALADPIALASGGPIQAEWRRQQLSAEERAQRFRDTIISQFSAIIDKLCDAAAAELRRAASFKLDHFRMSLLHSIAESRRLRHEALDRCLATLADGMTGRAQYVRDEEQELATQRARADAARRVTTDLLTIRD